MKKIISLILCLSISLSSLNLPLYAKAEDAEPNTPPITNSELTTAMLPVNPEMELDHFPEIGKDDTQPASVITPMVGIMPAATTGGWNWTDNGDDTVTITGAVNPMWDIVIPSEIEGKLVTCIGDAAFYDCTYLTSITLPDSVISIGNMAFYNCSRLTSITIPDSVISIGSLVFSGCSYLANVSVNDKNQYFTSENGVLFNKDKSDLLYYPMAKSGKAYQIPDGVVNVGNAAFRSNRILTSVTIPDSVISIGIQAFYDCFMTSITIPASVVSIQDGAFFGSRLENITILGVTSIGDHAFAYCYYLTDITIQGGITSIDDGAFTNCQRLISIDIPEGVTSIGRSSFSYCLKLESIAIPASVISIGIGAFMCCSNLTDISVDSENKYYTSENGVLFDKDKSILLCYPTAKSDLTYKVLDGVIEIIDTSFFNCFNLLSIAIPSSVTIIGDYAFSACSNLLSITIPASVKSIGDGAFSNCSNLTIYCSLSSYARTYAIQNKINYADWGLKVIFQSSYVSSYKGFKIALIDETQDIESSAVVTDALIYWLGEVNTDSVYRLELISPYGEIAESITEITFKTVDDSEMTLTATNPPKEINLSVKNSSGQLLGANYTVNWYYVDADEVIASGDAISNIIDPTKFSYQVVLDEIIGIVYREPSKQSLDAFSANTVECLLQSIPQLALIGKVVDANEQAIAGAEITIVQMLNGRYAVNQTVTSDSQGIFIADVLDDLTKIVITKENYYTKTILDVQKEFTTDPVDLGSVRLEKLILNKVILNITKTNAVRDDETATVAPQYSTTNLSFSLYNETQSKEITRFTVQYPYLLIEDDSIKPGDVIRVTVKDILGKMTAEASGFTLDAALNGSVTINFVENGAFEAQILASENASDIAMLFDAAGNYVKTYAINDGWLTGDALPCGNYQLVFMGKTDLLTKISSISKLRELNVKFAEEAISITNGKILSVNIKQIPYLDETSLYYTDNQATRFSLNKNDIPVGNLITLRAEYEIQEKFQTSGEYMSFDIPAGVEFIENSVTIDGLQSFYEKYGNTITIRTNKPKAIIRFYVAAKAEGSYVIDAFLSFSYENAALKQPLGAVNLNATALEISVPAKTGQRNVTVKGVAAPISQIKVFDNGTYVGETTANAVGSWQLSFDLIKPYTYSFHEIYAEATLQGVTIRSEAKELMYNATYTEVSKVTMIQNGQNTVFDFINPSKIPPHYSFNPSHPSFTFMVEFTNSLDAEVSDVYVVTKDHGGNYTKVKTVYDEAKGIWVGTHSFYSFTLPTWVGVEHNQTGHQAIFEYQMYSDLYDEVQQKALSDVADMDELLNELDKAFDIKVTEEANKSVITVASKAENDNDTEEILAISKEALDFNSYNFSQLTPQGYTKILASSETNEYIYVKELDDNTALGMEIIYPATKEAYRVIIENGVVTELLKTESEYQNLFQDAQITLSRYHAQALNLTPDELLSILKDVTDIAAKIKQIADKINNIYVKLNNIVKVMDIGSKLLGSIGMLLTPKNVNLRQRDFEASLSLAYSMLNKLCSDGKTPLVEYEVQIEAYNLLSEFSTLFRDAELSHLTITSIIFGISILVSASSVAAPLAIPIIGLAFTALCLEYNRRMDDLFNKLTDAPILAARKALKLSNVQCPPTETDDPEEGDDATPDDSTTSGIGSSATPVIDPSGYVYEAVPSNRLENVTTTIFYSANEQGANPVLWNATDYDQENPLITDSEGRYAWDVPIGWWQVRYDKAGYETAYSEWLPVPPPQTEVNIGMVSHAAPDVLSARGYEDYIEVMFDKYMDTSLFTGANIVLSGYAGTYDLILLDAEEAPNGSEYARTVHLVPSNDKFTMGETLSLTIYEAVQSYAGEGMAADYQANVEIKLEPKSIYRPTSVSLNYGKTKDISVTILPTTAGKGQTITAVSSSPQIVSVNSQSTTNESATASFTLKGEMSGTAEIALMVDGTQVVNTISVSVELPNQVAVDKEKAAQPTANLPGGKVAAGTELILNTATNGAIIYYTTDASCPCSEGTRQIYTGPIILTQNISFYISAYKDGMDYSPVLVLNFTVDNGTTTQTHTISAIAGLGGKVSGGGIRNKNELITLTASPDEGYTFDGWYENGNKIPGAGASYSFTVSGDRTLEARFSATTTTATEYTVTVTAGTGGTVTGEGTFAAGSQVTVTATPQNRYSFAGWYENDTKISGANATYTFVVLTDRTLEARFNYINSGGSGSSGGGSGNSGSSSGNAGSSSGGNDDIKSGNNIVDKSAPDTVAPSGDTVSWSSVQDQIASANDGDKIVIDMQGETELPVAILDAIRGKDATIVINMGVYSWTINGLSIGELSSGVTSYDLKVTEVFDAAWIALANGYDITLLELAHNGAFPFTGNLIWNVDTSHHGNEIYLSYYNETLQRLELRSRSSADSSGEVIFTFEGASEYALTTLIAKGTYVKDSPNVGALSRSKQECDVTAYVPYLIVNGEAEIVKLSGIVGSDVVFTAPADGVYEFRSNKKTFNDISGHWAVNTIASITSRELFAGIGDDKFNPDGGMTRAMFATVLSRLDGVDLSGYKVSPFADVEASIWYGRAIAWAADKGIINGYGGGLFGPDDLITREQMAVMLSNYIEYKGIELKADNYIPFVDDDEISSWARDAVADMKRYGLITGIGNNVSAPLDTATRATVAQIFMNFINAFVE